jgi:hypothetical protein
MAFLDGPFVRQTLFEFNSLVKAPFDVPEMWWIVVPLLAVIFVMTFYFGKYINEKLGWNTALGNSVVLFFVCVDLLRKIYNYTFPPSFENYAWYPVITAIIFVIILESVLLLSAAFKHALPEKVMYFIASPVAVNVQAYVMAAVVYTRADFTFYTLFAAVLLFIVMIVILRLIKEAEHLLFGYHFKTTPKPKK